MTTRKRMALIFTSYHKQTSLAATSDFLYLIVISTHVFSRICFASTSSVFFLFITPSFKTAFWAPVVSLLAILAFFWLKPNFEKLIRRTFTVGFRYKPKTPNRIRTCPVKKSIQSRGNWRVCTAANKYRQLMKSLGLSAYRYSTSRSRSFLNLQTQLASDPCPLYMAIGYSSREHFELVVQ